MYRYWLALLLLVSPACARLDAVAPAGAPTVAATPARAAAAVPPARSLTLPLQKGSVRFAVIGDNGTGDRYQREVADRMLEYRERFPYDFVIMNGDNIYGSDNPTDMRRKFEEPYKALTDAGVKFYACLGNHDQPGTQKEYKPFNMNEEQYYTFTKGNVRFFALDSNYMDKPQLDWLAHELELSKSNWKIAYFHHPLYSSGLRHGSEVDLRVLVEPLFVKYGVNVVLSGHDHFYERIKPQQGIYYFVVGSSGQLRKGNISPKAWTAKGFDTDRAFMLVEIAGDEMYFQTIARTGETIDSGVIKRQERKETNGTPR